MAGNTVAKCVQEPKPSFSSETVLTQKWMATMTESRVKTTPGFRHRAMYTLTTGSNRSLRSLGRAKARPLTKR